MKCWFLAIFFGLAVSSLLGQETDTIPKIDTALVKSVIENLAVDSLLQDSSKVDSIQTEETRAERRARLKAEKEREKYYFKGIKKDSARLHIEYLSRVAWKRSLMVPGWGQYTNGGLWWIKVPIIYGGFIGAYFTFDYWQFYYSEYLKELQFRFENNGEPSDGPLGQVSVGNEQYLIRMRDFARRNRDITILATIGWYSLNAVEAYVDSMLKNRWNISDDLSMRISPTMIPMNSAMPMGSAMPNFTTLFTPGIKLKFNIN